MTGGGWVGITAACVAEVAVACPGVVRILGSFGVGVAVATSPSSIRMSAIPFFGLPLYATASIALPFGASKVIWSASLLRRPAGLRITMRWPNPKCWSGSLVFFPLASIIVHAPIEMTLLYGFTISTYSSSSPFGFGSNSSIRNVPVGIEMATGADDDEDVVTAASIVAGSSAIVS